MATESILSAIKSRRSIRKYTGQEVSDNDLTTILEAGQWSPSGLNNQPWKFQIIRDQEVKEKLSGLTKYSRIVKECDVCISVYYHLPSGYNRDKDLLGLGACIQNMLLGAHALGIGTVWLGQILNQKEEVHDLLESGEENELVAVIACGHPAEEGSSSRKELETLMLKEF